MIPRRTVLKAGAAAAVAGAIGVNPATPAAAKDGAAKDRAAENSAALQSALDRIAETAASGVLAEVRDPHGVWRGSSGVSELGTSKRVVPTGRFRVGSVTKSFVSTVVLQLVAERRLGLDDPVRRWLPGHDGVTVRNLLQHTSGIADYTSLLDQLYPTIADLVRRRYRTWTPRELLALIAGRPPLFAPGTSWSYSSTNYILLGLVIERVTGRGYADEIRHRILTPLGLHSTETPGTNPYVRGPHSHGYLLDENGATVDITALNPSIAGASGDMLSTAADLNRFYRALHTGRLVPGPLLTKMRTVFPGAAYGLGLQTKTTPTGVTLWGHTGGIFGYYTYSFSTADGRRQLTLSTNPWGDGDLGLADLLTAAFPAEPRRQ